MSSMTEESGLQERLIAAALELLKDRPAESLSLRHVALQVGVSHQAPYVHFGDKRRFLAAVAGAGMEIAATEAASAVQAAGNDPRLRLHALVEAYVAFSDRHPHLDDLANGSLVAKADHPRLQAAAITYWDLFHDTVAACQPEGVSEAEVLRRCAVSWGTVYGIARLDALHQIPAAVPSHRAQLLHEAIDTVYHGWQSQRIAPGQPIPQQRPHIPH
jgi:AcrR family transcriptional regulator